MGFTPNDEKTVYFHVINKKLSYAQQVEPLHPQLFVIVSPPGLSAAAITL